MERKYKLDEETETVEISVDEYGDLVLDSTFLRFLFETGLDDWEGYDEAVDAFQAFCLEVNDATIN